MGYMRVPRPAARMMPFIGATSDIVFYHYSTNIFTEQRFLYEHLEISRIKKSRLSAGFQ